MRCAAFNVVTLGSVGDIQMLSRCMWLLLLLQQLFLWGHFPQCKGCLVYFIRIYLAFDVLNLIKFFLHAGNIPKP